MLEQMILIRQCEETLTRLFTSGLVFGTTHSCNGQEAVAVGVVNALGKNDIVVSNHRGHGHYLAFTDDIDGLLAEIMGKKTGACAGLGGSQHLCKTNFFSNGITGGMVPVATGLAFAERLKGSGNAVVVFMGDGALGQGVVYESWNMAALWNLPILYVIENNYYAMSTSIETHLAGAIGERSRSFGIETDEIEGMDVEQVFEKTVSLRHQLSVSNGPQVLICNTYRFCGHSKSDDLCYRSREEEREWLEKDPIGIASRKLDNVQLQGMVDRADRRIKLAVEKAESAPVLGASDLI